MSLTPLRNQHQPARPARQNNPLAPRAHSEQFQAVGAALGRDVGLPLTATSRSQPHACILHSAGDVLDHGFVFLPLSRLLDCERSAGVIN